MSKVLLNERLSQDFFLLKVAQRNNAKMGQFYMLRAWLHEPVLSRPISVYDACGETVSFLYKVVGRGTQIFSELRPGDDITLQGPLGNTFPDADGNIAMVGGGVGIAPLYFAAKQLKAASPAASIDFYLGFSSGPLLVEEFGKVADSVKVNVGGFITDEIDPTQYSYIMTCGPEPMMKALYGKCMAAGVGDRLWVSMENRMACGIGACLVCSCKTKQGNKKACKDGPVFRGEEVFGI